MGTGLFSLFKTKPAASKVLLGQIALSAFEASNPALPQPLRDFLASHRVHRFHAMRIECGLDPAPRERFEAAHVRVELSPLTPAGAAPIAWTLEPRQETKWLSDDATKLSLGADLKGVVKAGVEQTSSKKREALLLEAYGVQTSEPYWRLTRRRGTRLSGSRPLWVVVQAPLTNWQASACVTSTVRKKRLRLLPGFARSGPSARTRLEAPQA